MSKRKLHKFVDNIEHKHCSKCLVWKPVSDFGVRNTAWDKLQDRCRECIKEITLKNKEHRKEYLEKNKEKFKEYRVKQYQEKKEIFSEKKKAYRKLHPEKHKEYNDKTKQKRKDNYFQNRDVRIERMGIYYEKNKTKFLQQGKEYRIKNKEKIKERQKIYVSKRLKSDPQYRFSFILRCRMRMAIKGQKGFKQGRSKELLGSDLNFIKQYIEHLFEEGMTWENYGNKVNQWSIDHIIPCTAFNLTNLSEQKICFHYTNLRPMWHTKNMEKFNKYNEIDKLKYIENFDENGNYLIKIIK